MARPIDPKTQSIQVTYLMGLCQGKRVKEIADETGVPLGSITRELHRLRKAQGVRNNVQLAAKIVFGL